MSGIYWLYGPVGAGKSAIAQSLAEVGQEEGYLASSFFFSRQDPKRNTAHPLFLTIAYGLANSIPELRDLIEHAIRENPDLLQASLEEQFQRLIVEPCKSLSHLHDQPWLIIIDGLDECIGSQEQQRILLIIATALFERIRLCFLLCSRPEPSIRFALNADTFKPYLHRVALDDSLKPGRDIQIFLTDEFKRIRNGPLKDHIQFPDPWPESDVIRELAQKACGQFIYAKTVLKFVDNQFQNPCSQLQVILGRASHPDRDTVSPFGDLDVLYHQILTSNPQRAKVKDVVRAVITTGAHEPSLATPRHIEALLVLQDGEVISTLCGMHSALDIGGPEERILTLHTSFIDFAHDQKRSDYFFVGDEHDQHHALACHFLRHIRRCSQGEGDEQALSPPQHGVFNAAWRGWGYHSSASHLDTELLEAIRSVEFTVRLKLYLSRCLSSRLDMQFDTYAMLKLQHFFWAIQELSQHNEAKSHPDLYRTIRRFSRYGTRFRVKLTKSESENAGTILSFSSFLSTAAKAICFHVIPFSNFTGSWLHTLLQVRVELQNILVDSRPKDLHVISVGDDCVCMQRREVSDYASLRCSEAPCGDVYHVQLSVAMRDPAVEAIYREDWKPHPVTNRLRMSSDDDINSVTDVKFNLCAILDLCGPCPQLLKVIPRLFSRIECSEDRDGIVKWLKSFPDKYSYETSSLIAQIEGNSDGCSGSLDSDSDSDSDSWGYLNDSSDSDYCILGS
ncbi:hypothetical protein VNI00_011283 [Paramarasmius palmivorus]|uniref:NACHT domain-containing protein n=1 Tax=Paramarasmius palmivorus TaxID=297713 RepID=A0AAW0CE94_9AGAR